MIFVGPVTFYIVWVFIMHIMYNYLAYLLNITTLYFLYSRLILGFLIIWSCKFMLQPKAIELCQQDLQILMAGILLGFKLGKIATTYVTRSAKTWHHEMFLEFNVFMSEFHVPKDLFCMWYYQELIQVKRLSNSSIGNSN